VELMMSVKKAVRKLNMNFIFESKSCCYTHFLKFEWSSTDKSNRKEKQ